MKVGDKIKYGADDRIWVITELFRSFILVQHGHNKRPIYKEFWPDISSTTKTPLTLVKGC